MVQFSDLPPELRAKIWRFSLPGPRLLHIKHEYNIPGQPKRDLHYGPHMLRTIWQEFSVLEFLVTPESYGLHHPIALSVNRESRAEALRVLTKHLNVYWNMQIDVPYFEMKSSSHYEAQTLSFAHREGLLEPFTNIGIDANVWAWHASCYRCNGPLMPREVMDQMPHLKSVYLTYTRHTTEGDAVIEHQSWTLGDLTAEVAVEKDFESTWTYGKMISDYQRQPVFVKTGANNYEPKDYEWFIRGIHGRERKRCANHDGGYWPLRSFPGVLSGGEGSYWWRRDGRGCT